MTKGVIRGYAVSLSLLGFASAWTAVSGSPWPAATEAQSSANVAPAADPRVAALDAREARLRKRAEAVRATLAGRRARAVAAQQVRVVTLPPITQTQTS